jgi:hypothetical protein
MYWYDSLYWVLLAVCAVLSLGASMLVKGTFARYSRYSTRRGLNGAEVARRILRDNGIDDVKVEPVAGSLSDHYDPRTKTLRLSEPVFASDSMAAVGVAAHEVGHAIQHARAYLPLKFRSAWVPVANLGGVLSGIVIMLALVMGGVATTQGNTLAWVGIAMFAATTLFTLITLPVEFDASRRALLTLENGGYLSAEELAGARKVLNAAALTYVAAFVTSLLTLLYYAYRLGLFGQRRDRE